jgi:transcriptional regulator with XRE-family HTH domain
LPRHKGLDLKIKRMRARLTQEQLASGMGVSRVRVGQIEGMPAVSTVVEERYLTGLTRARLAKSEKQKEVIVT